MDRWRFPRGLPTPGGLPLLKPPYGRVVAQNLNTGDQAWMTPYGTPAANVLNNPTLKAINYDMSKLGGSDRSPLLVTRTLFVGGGAKLRVLDKKTGRIMNEIEVGGAVTGGPMTYMMNGRQFIVVTVGGGQNGHEFVALTLPQARPAAPAKAKPAAGDAQARERIMSWWLSVMLSVASIAADNPRLSPRQNRQRRRSSRRQW